MSGSLIGSGNATNAHGFFSHKLSKIIADRQTIAQQKSTINIDEDGKFSEMNTQNGKNDSWQEDQEVLYFIYFCM